MEIILTRLKAIRLGLLLISYLYLVVGTILLINTNTTIATMSPLDWLLAVIGASFVLIGLFLTILVAILNKDYNLEGSNALFLPLLHIQHSPTKSI